MAGEPEGADFISRAEVGRRLGISDGTLDGLINRGELPAYRIGSRIRVRRSDLDDYLAAARIEPGSLGETAAPRTRRQIRETAIEPVLIQPTKLGARRKTRITTVGEAAS